MVGLGDLQFCVVCFYLSFFLSFLFFLFCYFFFIFSLYEYGLYSCFLYFPSSDFSCDFVIVFGYYILYLCHSIFFFEIVGWWNLVSKINNQVIRLKWLKNFIKKWIVQVRFLGGTIFYQTLLIFPSNFRLQESISLKVEGLMSKRVSKIKIFPKILWKPLIISIILNQSIRFLKLS